MRRILVVIALTLGLVGLRSVPPAEALPHGCASQSSDFSADADADAFRRRAGVRVYRDEPCTFFYAAGDTYTGNGRFSVACASGGYLYHPDHEDDTPEHNDRLVPIPQPCKLGDLVTIDGFHPFTGGVVVAGGLGQIESGTVPATGTDDALSRVPEPNSDFAALCDAGSETIAAVRLTAPVARSGYLTFGGTVDCRGASVSIKSVKISAAGGFPRPAYAGTAHCQSCRNPLTVSGRVPPRVAEFDVEMRFDVVRKGAPTVHAYRLGRYVVS